MHAPGNLPELMTERARVLRVSGGVAWVNCESQAGCARCAAGEGCGAGLFAKLLRGRLQELPVALPRHLDHLVPGDQVLVGLSVRAVQSASFLLYGLPLAGLLAGAVLCGIAWPGDAAAFAGAAAGLCGGAWLARRKSAALAGDSALQPVLLQRLDPLEPCPARPEA